MSDDLDDLRCRLVVGHKRDGRSVYDEAAKSELVALCLQPGTSVSRLARDFGANANQVGRWLREHGHGRRRRRIEAGVATPAPAFVQVPVLAAPATGAGSDDDIVAAITVQARLPNGVAIDLHGIDRRSVGEVIEALGRLRCSVSTRA